MNGMKKDVEKDLEVVHGRQKWKIYLVKPD